MSAQAPGLPELLASDPQYAPLLALLERVSRERPELAQALLELPPAQGLEALTRLAQALAGGGQENEQTGPGPGMMANEQAGAMPGPGMMARDDGPEPPPGVAGPLMVPPGAQPPPGGQPGPGGPVAAGPPAPAPTGPADVAPGSVADLLAELPPNLARLLRRLRFDQQQRIVALYQERGIGAVQALLTQVEVATREGGTGPRTAVEARDRPRRPAKRGAEVPSFTLPDLPPNRWGARGPAYATVRRHLDQATSFWSPRDERIAEDIELYNRSRSARGLPTGPHMTKAADPLRGDVVYVSSRPFQLVERVTSYVSATGPRKPATECPPWSDDDETISAAQALEDWLAYTREREEHAYTRRGASGDPRPPLPRDEAGGMALMGGAGFRVVFDPGDRLDPIRCEYVPINRLYPLPGIAMLYKEQMTLSEARTIWKEIDDYYPPEDEETSGRATPPPSTQVTVAEWTDVYPRGQGGRWHGIFWVTGDTGDWGDEAEPQRAKWIKRPEPIDFGFSPLQYVIWGGATYFATPGIADYERFRGMGVLTPLRRTFKLLDVLWSAVATQALKAVDPAVVQYYHPGTRKEDMLRVDTRPGMANYMVVGENVQPLIWSVSGAPDGQAIIRALYEEIQAADNPIMGGGGNAESGVQQSMQASSAGYLSVNPIIDALEGYYSLQNELRIELLIRKGKAGELKGLPFSSRPAEDQFDMSWPTMRDLTPKTAELNGTRNRVTYQRLSLVERQLLWNMLGQAVQGKLLNARDAMKEMGIANPARNLLRILQEQAVTNPKSLEAMIGASIMGGDNALFQIGWQQVLAGSAMGGGGSPPAERGVPSAAMPQITGGPQGGPPQGQGAAVPVLG